jgi:hypothetical protein
MGVMPMKRRKMMVRLRKWKRKNPFFIYIIRDRDEFDYWSTTKKETTLKLRTCVLGSSFHVKDCLGTSLYSLQIVLITLKLFPSSLPSISFRHRAYHIIVPKVSEFLCAVAMLLYHRRTANSSVLCFLLLHTGPFIAGL